MGDKVSCLVTQMGVIENNSRCATQISKTVGGMVETLSKEIESLAERITGLEASLSQLRPESNGDLTRVQQHISMLDAHVTTIGQRIMAHEERIVANMVDNRRLGEDVEKKIQEVHRLAVGVGDLHADLAEQQENSADALAELRNGLSVVLSQQPSSSDPLLYARVERIEKVLLETQVQNATMVQKLATETQNMVLEISQKYDEMIGLMGQREDRMSQDVVQLVDKKMGEVGARLSMLDLSHQNNWKDLHTATCQMATQVQALESLGMISAPSAGGDIEKEKVVIGPGVASSQKTPSRVDWGSLARQAEAKKIVSSLPPSSSTDIGVKMTSSGRGSSPRGTVLPPRPKTGLLPPATVARPSSTTSGPSCPGLKRSSSGVLPSPIQGSRLEMVRPPPVHIPCPSVPVEKNVRPEVIQGGSITPAPSLSSEGTRAGAKSRITRQEKVPVGSRGHLSLDCLGMTPMSSVPSFPPSALQNAQARVNMIGQNPTVVGVANPLLSEALRASRVRKFSGKAEDFEDFEREWVFHLKLMHGASQGVLPDAVVLMTLRNYLDEASAALLQGKMCIDPDLSYYEFWDELKSQLMRDARTMHRQNWRAVKLVTNGSRVTLQEWAKFQAVYVSKRALVEDWSDAEDQQHVFSQVPSGLQLKILAETRKRRSAKLWVRVVTPTGMTNAEVLSEIEAELGFTPHIVSQEKRHFVIACRNDTEVRGLMDLDGSKIDRHVLKVQRAEYNMSGDEIFAFMRRLLETDEELLVLRRSYGCADPPTRREVHAVQLEPKVEKTSAQESPREGGNHGNNNSRPPYGKYHGRSPAPKRNGHPPLQQGRSPQSSPLPSPKGEGKGKERLPIITPVCYACRRLGEPCDHDHLKCAKWQASRGSPVADSRKGRETPPAQTRSRSE